MNVLPAGQTEQRRQAAREAQSLVKEGRAGQGLAGLRGRVEVLGGRFEAGPDEDGGFRVMMQLPLSAWQ